MSDDKNETITIEVPLDWARQHSVEKLVSIRSDVLSDACRTALAARKSKYEQWRCNISRQKAIR